MLTLAALFAVSATGLAQASVATPAAPAKAAVEKRSCRSTYATGSIMNARICHSHAEWARIDAASQQKIDSRANSSTIQRSQGGAGDGRDSFGQ